VTEAHLREEARLFGRYLIGRDPDEAIIERYCQANRVLFASDEDDAVLAFARSHPWSLAMLDAGAGLTGGDSVLRKKLLVMTAIVETTAQLVDRFEQRAVSLPQLAWRLGVAGVRTAFHASTGVALVAWVKRRA
jgi:hypothetical protein